MKVSPPQFHVATLSCCESFSRDNLLGGVSSQPVSPSDERSVPEAEPEREDADISGESTGGPSLMLMLCILFTILLHQLMIQGLIFSIIFISAFPTDFTAILAI